MQIFCLFHFCILCRVGTAVFCNFLWVYLLAVLRFDVIYVFTCLPYFFYSDLMLCLIVFYRQITHIDISCFSAGCCWFHLLDLSNFLCTHFRFCCLHSRFMLFTLLLASCFDLLQLLLMFVWLVSCLLFLIFKLAGLNKFALARFRVLWRRCLFFCTILTYVHVYRTALLFLPLIFTS